MIKKELKKELKTGDNILFISPYNTIVNGVVLNKNNNFCYIAYSNIENKNKEEIEIVLFEDIKKII
jgi:hypothetical protein